MFTRSINAIVAMLEADVVVQGNLEHICVGVSSDSRTIHEDALYIPLVGETFDGHTFIEDVIKKGVQATLWNKDVKPYPKGINVILVDDTLMAMGKLASRYRDSLDITIVGITGSNGKTSAKDMMASILQKCGNTKKTQGNFNNEIGVPLTLFSFDEDTQYGVVEMGMEQAGEISYLTHLVKPDVALITSIGSAHIVHLKSIENIAKAKLEIIQGIKQGGTLVYNGMQDVLKKAVLHADIPEGLKLQAFGEASYQEGYLHGIEQYPDHSSFLLNDEAYELSLIGAHQVQNAAGVVLCAKALHIPNDKIVEGLRNVELTGMRDELIPYGDSVILNDSYKSNPQSLLAALAVCRDYPKPYRVAIIGDMFDLGEDSNMMHYDIGKQLKDYNIDEVVTFGDEAMFILQALKNNHSDILGQHMFSYEEIIQYITTFKTKESVILIKGSRGMHMDKIVDGLMEEKA